MPGNHQTLLQLTYIRFVLLLGLGATVLFAVYYLQAGLSLWHLAAGLGLMGLLNLITYARLHSPWPVTEPELFSHLMADSALYGLILYHCGGATHPFIFILLIPLIIAVMALSLRYIWLMAVTLVAIYTSLLLYYQPVTPQASGHLHSAPAAFNLHMIGMWLNFMLTVGVITYFLSRMNQSLKRSQQQLLQKREEQLRQQQIVALGTAAAGTAHELGTPLSTMKIILREMSLAPGLTADMQEDIALLQQQVDQCSSKLQLMTRSVAEEEIHSEKTSLVTEFLDEVLESWAIMRPEATFHTHIMDDLPPDVRNSTALRQAILNLLNNAADACPKQIQINLTWDKTTIYLHIRDRGPGIPIEQMDKLGTPFITTKGKGLGIGLFLTSTTLASYDGEVRLYQGESGGTVTEVRLPRRAVHG